MSGGIRETHEEILMTESFGFNIEGRMVNRMKDQMEALGLPTTIDFVYDDGGRSKVGYKSRVKNADDCVVRSIAIALDLPYDQVFRELMYIGLELGLYPNARSVHERYLKAHGWVKNKCPRNASGNLIKLRDWCSAPHRAVVSNSRHLTAIVDGKCRDTWDCTYRPVNSYWTKA